MRRRTVSRWATAAVLLAAVVAVAAWRSAAGAPPPGTEPDSGSTRGDVLPNPDDGGRGTGLLDAGTDEGRPAGAHAGRRLKPTGAGRTGAGEAAGTRSPQPCARPAVTRSRVGHEATGYRNRSWALSDETRSKRRSLARYRASENLLTAQMNPSASRMNGTTKRQATMRSGSH